MKEPEGRREGDHVLRQSERRLASVVRAAGLGFYEATKSGQFTFLDDRAADLLDLPPARNAFVHEHWIERLHPGDRDRVLEQHRAVLAGRVDRTVSEYRYRHSRLGSLWIHHVTQVLEPDGAGRALRLIGVVRDVTERKRNDSELMQLRLHSWHADRVAQIGTITTSLAHELNQPLAAILANAQAGLRFIDRGEPDLAEIRAILTDIVHDDKRAASVISGVRSMLRRSEPRRSPISLAGAIRTVLDILHSEMLAQRVEPRVSLARDCRVWADEAQIQQVLLNLVMNAVQAMHEQPVEQRGLEITLTQTSPGEAAVAVRDSGSGIDEELSAKVFEAFWTTKKDGMGVGLALSRSIVEAHGGHLWFERNPDRGTTFHVTLPLAAEREPVAPVPDPCGSTRGG